MRFLPFLLLLLFTQNTFAIGSYYYFTSANGTFDTAQAACNAFAKARQGTGVLTGNTCTVGSQTANIHYDANLCPKGVGGTYPSKVLYRSSDVSSNLTLSQAESRTSELLAKAPSTLCSSSCSYVSPSITFLTTDGNSLTNFNYVYEANGTVCTVDNTGSIPSQVNLSGGGDTGGGDTGGGDTGGGDTGGGDTGGGDTGGGNTGGGTVGGTVTLSPDDKRILNNIIVKQIEQIKKDEENTTWLAGNIKDNIQKLGDYIGSLSSALTTNLGNWFSELKSAITGSENGGGDTGGGDTGGGDTGGGDTGGGDTGGEDDGLEEKLKELGSEKDSQQVNEAKENMDNAFNKLTSSLTFSEKACPSDISVNVPIYKTSMNFVIPLSEWCSLMSIIKLMLYISVYMQCIRMLTNGVMNL